MSDLHDLGNRVTALEQTLISDARREGGAAALEDFARRISETCTWFDTLNPQRTVEVLLKTAREIRSGERKV